MFEDNWYLFLLIVFLVFATDGGLSSTEIAVMGAILFALTLSGNGDEVAQPCFGNHGAQ